MQFPFSVLHPEEIVLQAHVPPGQPWISTLHLLEPGKGVVVSNQNEGGPQEIILQCLYLPLNGQGFPFDDLVRALSLIQLLSEIQDGVLLWVLHLQEPDPRSICLHYEGVPEVWCT